VSEPKYTGVKDDDGEKLYVGDSVRFSYGIPPVAVIAPIVEIKSHQRDCIYALTPDHSPKKCLLRKLRQNVGNIYLDNRSKSE